jgi:hypothetical protein
VFSMYSAPRPLLVTDKWTRSLARGTCFLWGPCRRTIRGSRITEQAVQEGWVEVSILYGTLWSKELQECGCEGKTWCVILGVCNSVRLW